MFLLAFPFNISEFIVFSHLDSIVIPSEFEPLTSTIFVSCGVVSSSNFTTRWITPSNEIVNSGNTNSRYTFLEGDVNVDGRPFVGTALVISGLSYEDEGTYTCEGQDLFQPEIRDQARINLELLGVFYII